MAANPITYAQLFDFSKPQDLNQAIKNVRELGTVYDKLISEIESRKDKYVKAVGEIITSTNQAAKARKDLDISTEKGRKATLEDIKATEKQFETYQNLNKTIKQSEVAVTKLKKEKEDLNKKSKELIKLENEEVRLKEKLASLNTKEAKEVANLRAQIAAKNAELKKSAKEALNLVSIYQKETAVLNNLRNRYKDVALQYGINSKQARTLRTELTALDARIKSVDASAGQFQRNVGNYRSGLAGLATGFRQVASALGFTGLIFAIVGAFRGAFNIFKEFQRENAVLAGVLGKTRGEIKALTDDATRLGASTAKTATEVTKLQIEYARLGFTEREIIQLTESTIQGSVALNAELDRTAALVGAIVRTFDDLDTADAPQIVDQLTLAANSSALSFSKLETALPIVSGAANAVGLELSEVLSVLGKLSDAGIDASTSATAFRNILIESAKRGKSYKELLDQVRTSTNQLTTANDLFGKRGAVQAVILANNSKALEELNKQLGSEFAGKAGKAAAVQLDNVSGSATLAKSAIEGFVLSIENGNGALSTFAKNFIDSFTQSISLVTAYNEGLITTGELLAATVNPLKAVEIRTRLFTQETIKAAEKQANTTRILEEAQRRYNSAIEWGINNFGDFQSAYGDELDKIQDKTEVLAEIERLYTNQLIKDNDKIIEQKSTSIAQLESEIKLLNQRLKLASDFESREDILNQIQLKKEEIARMKESIQVVERFKRVTGLLTEEITKQTRANNPAIAQLKELGRLYSKEGTLGKNVDEFLKNVEIRGVEAPRKAQTAFERFTQSLQSTFSAFGEFINAGFEVASIALNQFFTNANIRRDNEFKAFEDHQQAQIDILEARREKEIENENLTAEAKKAINDRYAKQIDAIEDKIEAKRRQNQRKQAVNAKAQAALNVALNTAQGVTAALATANVPLSISIGVIGAAQLAAVLSQPIPAYAEGTPKEGHPGGLATVGEKGREMVVTPDGQISFTPSKATMVDLPEGAHVLDHVTTQRLMNEANKDYEGNKAINEVMAKIAGNSFDQKRFEQLFKSETDELIRGFSSSLKSLPLNVWGLTDKGQLTRSVRKGNTIHKDVSLDNKY